jgi:pyruvate ferredoxin oxidoreductase gamma subunit
MFQVRIHGRGGQGVVTAAEMLSIAAFREGRHAQAFPSFGSERTGAPVVAFCRLDTKEIRTREPVMAPNAVVIQDATLLHQVDVFSGLPADGYLLINTARDLNLLGLNDFARGRDRSRIVTVNATGIAVEHLGRPLPNAALLGAFAALTRQVSIDAVVDAIRETFGGKVGEGNAQAARAAHDAVAKRDPHGGADGRTFPYPHAGPLPRESERHAEAD